ncbi:MAG: DUF3102 domain-containing protein [Pseudomonadota bacterium]
MQATHSSSGRPLVRAKPKGGFTTKEAVEVGLELMRLRAAVQHGDFIPYLYLIDYSHSEATRLMRIARAFHGNAFAQLLEAAENVAKLNELLALDTDELAALKSGGEARGLTLRCLKDMTVLELRAAIRGEARLRVQASLTAEEARVLQAYRARAGQVEDVIDKRTGLPPRPIDLFTTDGTGGAP